MKVAKDFKFKQFTISQNQTTHKVGTDGVLIGAWVNVNNCKSVLDVGTGSGVIALMMAQRTSEHASIDAIEIQEDDAAQAMENVLKSPWPNKVNVLKTSFQEYQTSKKYDLIISNPPYFNKSWQPPMESRTVVRHTTTLSFPDLLTCALPLLADDGRLALILPYNEGLEFIKLASMEGLFVTRQCFFRSREQKPMERLLMEFSRQERDTVMEHLILHGSGESWSADYKALTKDFYLDR